jgi:hypothetical protein
MKLLLPPAASDKKGRVEMKKGRVAARIKN